jgi:hypothetical protein
MLLQPTPFECVGTRSLPLGGKNGYLGVRGSQGRLKDKFQGHTPKKKHCTELKSTAKEAALALAELKADLAEGLINDTKVQRKPRTKRAVANGTPRTHMSAQQTCSIMCAHLLM